MSQIAKVAHAIPRGVGILARRVKLKHIDNKPRHWHHNDPFMSHLMNAASLFFPEAERFFIRTVRKFEGQISDEQLKKDLKQFISQEAIHGHIHNQYNNDLIQNLGYDFMEQNERRIKGVFAFFNRYTSKHFQLAVTVALEHFSAMVAHMVLSNPQLMNGVKQDFQEVWQWHLMEELEHKSVSIDLYNAVGGSYYTRIAGMVFSLPIIVPFIIIIFYKMLKQDGVVNKDLWEKQKAYHQGNSPVFITFWEHLKPYFRRDFHPWELDDSHLIIKLKQKFYNEGVITDI
ncbi:MAG: hypothetical protein COB51_06950 [Moraxellaceae bacterium]|nr:MAG: hypothetical protein COB51_06950 [Moraxellaceae bacterium]